MLNFSEICLLTYLLERPVSWRMLLASYRLPVAASVILVSVETEQKEGKSSYNYTIQIVLLIDVSLTHLYNCAVGSHPRTENVAQFAKRFC